MQLAEDDEELLLPAALCQRRTQSDEPHHQTSVFRAAERPREGHRRNLVHFAQYLDQGIKALDFNSLA